MSRVTNPIVLVEDVHKRFDDVHALAGATLSIEAGTVYGLLGANGAGKTTLINVLSTLLEPTSGRAVIAGLDVTQDPQGVRRKIGLAGQFAAVDDYLTGLETVEMVGQLYGLSRRDARARAREVLERFTLTDAASRPASTYSGGMRRRLDLAASLVGRPAVLFLDEPTTGIDPGSRVDIWSLVKDLVDSGTTVLLTTQYLEEADELADYIGVINEGTIITEGTADELKDALGDNTIRLRVAEGDRAVAAEAISSIEGCVAGDAGTFEFPATDGNQTLLDVVRRLSDNGIEPMELTLERPTLDDVFLSLTGESASGAVDEQAIEEQRA